MSAMSVFGSAVITQGNSSYVTPIGTTHDKQVEVTINWLEIDANHYKATLSVNSKANYYYVTYLEYWAYDTVGNQLAHSSNVYTDGKTSKSVTITINGIFTEGQYASIRLAGMTNFKYEDAQFYKFITITPDTQPPAISLTKTDGNEVSSAFVGCTITDKTNVDTFSYKVIRDSDNMEIVPETLVDIVDTKTYIGSIPNLDTATIGAGSFTAFVKAKDTFGYESAWSTIVFAILGDDDVNAPTIIMNFKSPTMITGSAWQDCVPNKRIEWSVSDPSGLYSVNVYPILNGILQPLYSTSATGNFPLSDIGTYALYIEATDNDFDNSNPLDRSSGSATSETKTIVDDDTSGVNIDITSVSLDEGVCTIVYEMNDLDGIYSYWSSTIIPYPIFTSASGVDGYTINIYKDGELLADKTINHASGSINYGLETGTISVSGLGNYQVHIEAINGDNDRLNDADTRSKDFFFILADDDTTAPDISINTFDLMVLGTEVIITMYDLQTGIASWSIEMTHNGEPYLFESDSDANTIIPIVKTYYVTETGAYHIKVTATNNDQDREGDQETNVVEADFYVHDYTPPQISFEGDFDQTDANPQIINIKVTDEETGLSSVIILFGFDLNLLDELGIEININDLIMELLRLGIDIDLLDPTMIWIPIRITSDTIIEDIFNYVIDAFLGDIIGESGSDLILGLIQDYFGMNLEELMGDSWSLVIDYLGDYITEAFDWLDVQFAELITIFLNAIHDLILNLLLDEDFVVGQKTYEFSLDMKYFAWARIFGSFQFFVIASNTESLSLIFTTSMAFSNKYSLSDDDTSFDISGLTISGNENNIVIQFTDNDASGVSLLLLTIDNVPILPYFYTTTIVGNEWTIEIPRSWLVPLFGEDFHIATLYMMDNDNDWLIPYLVDPVYASFDLEFELIPPVITYEYNGDGTDSDAFANAGSIIFSITDDSEFTYTDSLIRPLATTLAMQTFSITAIDVFGNIATLSVNIQLHDDDTSVDISNLDIVHNLNMVNVSFTDIDASTIASCDWVKVDGEIVFFDYVKGMINFTNIWSLEMGNHLVEFQLTDADNDWIGDVSTQVFSIDLEITEADVVAWIDFELEELKTMVMECNCWKSNQGNGKCGNNNNHYQKTMINKINEIIALKEAGHYNEALDKLTHDIMPKLVGEKDSHGHDDFKNTWVSDPECMANFKAQIDPIISAFNLIIEEDGHCGNHHESGHHYHDDHHQHHHTQSHHRCH
jgi:hypothetical protein